MTDSRVCTANVKILPKARTQKCKVVFSERKGALHYVCAFILQMIMIMKDTQ
jgi:hypothetical protein